MSVTAANIQSQDFRFQLALASGLWRWTTRMDVSGLGPTFQVRDIITPFGILRDTIPLPGDVVQAMSASIDQLKANFAPRILVGPPSSLTFTVDEGRGFSLPQSVVLTNSGVYGSLLDVTLVGSAAYVSVSPPEVGNLASNETGSVNVSVDSTTLLSADSPYSEQVTIQDPDAANTPQLLPITINVRPKATISTDVDHLNFTVVRPLTGPFPSIPTQQFTITNTGPGTSLLDYEIQRLTGLSGDWLASFTPVNASLGSSASQATTVTITPIEGLAVGVYQETLRVSGYSTNSFVDVLIQLTIT